MTFLKSPFAHASIFFGLLVGQAQACPDGQSKGALGWCYPNIGGTVGQTFEAAKKGDLATVAKGLGDISITAACPMCAVAGQALLSKNDRAIISTVIGRGLILTAVGVPPSFVLFDAAGNVSQALQLRNQAPPIVAPAPPGRGVLTYKAITIAACAVQSSDNQVAVGWTSPPVLLNVATGAQSTFPNLDLRDKDVVTATANPCPESTVAQGGTSLSDVVMSYSYSQTVPGPDTQIKYFLIGVASKTQ